MICRGTRVIHFFCVELAWPPFLVPPLPWHPPLVLSHLVCVSFVVPESKIAKKGERVRS